MKFMVIFYLLATVLYPLLITTNTAVARTIVNFHPKTKFSSSLHTFMFIKPSETVARGSINYQIKEDTLVAEHPDAWQRSFSVRLKKRDDGGYEIYRMRTLEGKRDGKTLLNGTFYRFKDDDGIEKAILSYWENPEDYSWVRIEFSGITKSRPKKFEEDILTLKVRTSIFKGEPGSLGVRKTLEIEDELKWDGELRHYISAN